MFMHVEKLQLLMADKELSNGRIATLFATYSETADGGIMYEVDFIIANNQEEAVNWYLDIDEGIDSKLSYAITGNGSLEGLLFALAAIEDLKSYLRDSGDYISCSPSDDKRESAYRRLCKYGFKKDGSTYVYTK